MAQLTDDAARGHLGYWPRASPVEVLHGLGQRLNYGSHEKGHHQRGNSGQGNLPDKKTAWSAFYTVCV